MVWIYRLFVIDSSKEDCCYEIISLWNVVKHVIFLCLITLPWIWIWNLWPYHTLWRILESRFLCEIQVHTPARMQCRSNFKSYHKDTQAASAVPMQVKVFGASISQIVSRITFVNLTHSRLCNAGWYANTHAVPQTSADN